jgi:AraC family transcriptional regulator
VKKASSSWINYEQRLNRVTAYIYDHLDDDIDLNKLADIAYLSPYHWHRIYHAINGETLAATVKRLRLNRAAGYLANTTMPIAEIAEKSGYKDLQSFTRIFSSVYGLPPAQYRKNGSHTQFESRNPVRSRVAYDLTIETLPPMKTVSVEHVGSFMQIGKAFDVLYGWLGARNLVKPGMRSVAVHYDDSTAVAEEKLRSRACVIVDEEFDIAPPLQYTEIVGGCYAVLRHKGPYADMKAAYQWLYGEWVPQSDKEVGNAPAFEEYLNSPRDTAPMELLSDIYLPLK